MSQRYRRATRQRHHVHISRAAGCIVHKAEGFAIGCPAQSVPVASRSASLSRRLPKPAGTEHAKAESPKSKPAPAHAPSAPQAEHRSAPKPESKPPAAKQERKPPGVLL